VRVGVGEVAVSQEFLPFFIGTMVGLSILAGAFSSVGLVAAAQDPEIWGFGECWLNSQSLLILTRM
jgi:hypothetical protein